MRGLLPWVLALLLVACSTAPMRLSPADLEQRWQARQQALFSLSTWSLAGRIAIQTEEEGWHAALHWDQQGRAYDIKISSPLGQGLVDIQGDEQGVMLRTATETDFAKDPEALLYRRLGWHLPLTGLRFWALGLPDPNVPLADKAFDDLGRLTRLRQSGWEVAFRGYTRVSGIELPDKVFLSNQVADTKLEVRLAIQRWGIGEMRSAER